MTLLAEPPMSEIAAQIVAIPPDLADALERQPTALRSFERLSYSE
jgi:uncharacterized protein YdeI (YjbR/CyaY-like superfamily)